MIDANVDDPRSPCVGHRPASSIPGGPSIGITPDDRRSLVEPIRRTDVRHTEELGYLTVGDATKSATGDADDHTDGDIPGPLSAGDATVTANERAAAAADAIMHRHLRRMWWLPGTRLASVAWPVPALRSQFGMWHYWWHAHLVDLLTDAAIHRPPAGRAFAPDVAHDVNRLLNGIRLRNLGKWTNNYYDDMAWLGLAIERADRHLDLHHPKALAKLSNRMYAAWVPSRGGGIPWRTIDLFFNAPANGPAAILLARTGHVERAREMAGWMDVNLVDPKTHLIIDGIKPKADEMERVTAIYTYCQGVVLGTELELLRRTGEPLHLARIERLLGAVETELCRDGVIPGAGGGDGGLFAGILARYLALLATDLPDDLPDPQNVRARAAHIVRTSAEAAWANRAVTPAGPVFGADWGTSAAIPGAEGRRAQFIGGAVNSSQIPERDLSVQLSAWMTLEAAAAIELRQAEHDRIVAP